MAKTIEVLITIPFEESLVNQLVNVSPQLNITVLKARKSEEIPPDILARTEVLYTNRVIPLPELAPNLRWIQFHWAGVDHALEAPILKVPGLIATHLSGASASQMAEFAITMLLALGHHLPDLSNLQKHSEWPAERWERFSPVELRDSTVGIVGYGSIGRQLARLLQTFGAKVLATKRDAMHPEDTGYTPEGLGDPHGDFLHRLYPYQAIQSMLKECDFVVVTVPLTPQTRNLLGPAELAALKPTAFLVDIGRGGVIEQNALITALREHKIAGAALDVFPEEPLPADNPLWKLPNVILSPHIAGYSSAYDKRAVALFSENLTRYLAGLPLYNQINLEKGY
jgi:phosphoglycerate dehydrogenase-like enzyme